MPDTAWTRDDIELALLREYWRHGEQNTATLSSAIKRERIRVAILREKRERADFYDSGMTYLEAYRVCYGIALELRRYPRETTPAHRIEDVIDALDDEECE